MFKKFLGAVLITLLLFLAAGCGGGTEKRAEENTQANSQEEKSTQPKKTGDTITVGFIAASGQTSPQPLINYQYPIFDEQLKELGKKVALDSTRSLDDVWPKMDQDKWDFIYIPTGNFGTYVTETSKFGGSDKYVLLAGSLNVNGTNVIIARPEINSLKDLAGKKVGIANLRYWDEYQLNKLLANEGLGVKSMGGNVEVVWDDIVIKQLENWSAGKYDAIVIYSQSNIEPALKRVKGSKILADVNKDGIFGKNTPKYWFGARKELVENEPELVKAMLKGHILSTEKAIAEPGKLPEISREQHLKYFEDKKADMKQILEKNPLESFQKKWKGGEFTWDPNLKITSEYFDFMKERSLVKAEKLEWFINIEPLNEVLAEMGKPAIK